MSAQLRGLMTRPQAELYKLITSDLQSLAETEHGWFSDGFEQDFPVVKLLLAHPIHIKSGSTPSVCRQP